MASDGRPLTKPNLKKAATHPATVLHVNEHVHTLTVGLRVRLAGWGRRLMLAAVSGPMVSWAMLWQAVAFVGQVCLGLWSEH